MAAPHDALSVAEPQSKKFFARAVSCVSLGPSFNPLTTCPWTGGGKTNACTESVSHCSRRIALLHFDTFGEFGAGERKHRRDCPRSHGRGDPGRGRGRR